MKYFLVTYLTDKAVTTYHTAAINCTSIGEWYIRALKERPKESIIIYHTVEITEEEFKEISKEMEKRKS